jgi:hypothetical protein
MVQYAEDRLYARAGCGRDNFGIEVGMTITYRSQKTP